MKKFSLSLAVIFCLSSICLTASARDGGRDGARGGATSGSGDDDGLEVKQVLRVITEMINSNKTTIYTKEEKEALLTKAALAKIIMIDERLSEDTSVGRQDGAAFSYSNDTETVLGIQRARWRNISLVVERERLVHHELAIVAGLEQTGEYHLSDKFKKERAVLWDQLLSKKIICVVSLFNKKKNPQDGNMEPERLLGSGGVVMTSSTDVKGGWTPVTNEVVFRYVTSGTGYLRGVFSRATVDPSGRYFENTRESSQEAVYFTPYNLLEIDRGSTLKEWSDFFTMVNCAKI